MAKLLKYEYRMVRTFGDGDYETIYDLTIEKSVLFGLFRWEAQMTYTISMFGNIGSYTRHWDEMIKSGKRL